MWSAHSDLQLSFVYPLHFYDSSNILWHIFEISDGLAHERVNGFLKDENQVLFSWFLFSWSFYST